MIARTTAAPRAHFGAFLEQSWRFNRTLTIFTIGMSGVALAGLVGMALDPRMVIGLPAWAKTTKFAISFVAYGGALLWMLPLLTKRPRLVQWLANSIGALLAFEMVLIVIQAVRGVGMHFNVATSFDATLWSLMSGSIFLFWALTFVAAGLMLRQRLPDPALTLGMRAGMVLVVIGFGLGFLMTNPTAVQQAGLTSGKAATVLGAHTVGAEDGGAGLPLLGWSTEHGDLRIGHFVGIHAIQVVPLWAWWLGRRRAAWLGNGVRVALVWLATLGYAGVIALVTWQALRAQPLLRPDALTLAVAGTLVAVVGGAMAAVVGLARRRKRA